MSAAENRGADHRGESGVDQRLTAYHHEAAIELRVVGGVIDAIDFACASFASSDLDVTRLVPENVLNLSIQFIRSLVDEFKIAGFNLRARTLAQVLSENAFNER